MDIISTQSAPVAIGPYSQAIRSQGFLFCSGQLGIDPSTGKLISDEIEDQTLQAIKNLKSILESGGSGLKNIVKVTIFITSMDNFKKVNEIYGRELEGHKPARSTVEVSKLPLGAKVEIECIAE
ncbi:MAG: RidA family protein [Fibrobacter sp.]|nr:RidA family protein [Fibrobacter sp.]